jgi:hypothetical protein
MIEFIVSVLWAALMASFSSIVVYFMARFGGWLWHEIIQMLGIF